MRKFFIISAICLASSFSFGQTKFGLKLSPSLSTNRITNEIIDTTVTTNKSGVRFTFGPTLDFGISDHVSFSTGLWFTSKRMSMAWTDSNDVQQDAPVFGLHYLQLPVSVKYFSGEITDGMKIYFQVGGTLDFNITEKVISTDFDLATQKEYYDNVANMIDVGAYVGTGVEMEIGTSNILFAGFTYNRGLTNVLSKDYILNNKELLLSTQQIAIEAGIKF